MRKGPSSFLLRRRCCPTSDRLGPVQPGASLLSLERYTEVVMNHKIRIALVGIAALVAVAFTLQGLLPDAGAQGGRTPRRQFERARCEWVRERTPAGPADDCRGECFYTVVPARGDPFEQREPCIWQSKTFPADRFGPARTTKWCGCPNQEEPGLCHMVVVEQHPPTPPGATARFCTGACDPAGPTPCCARVSVPVAAGTPGHVRPAHDDLTCECSARMASGACPPSEVP